MSTPVGARPATCAGAGSPSKKMSDLYASSSQDYGILAVTEAMQVLRGALPARCLPLRPSKPRSRPFTTLRALPRLLHKVTGPGPKEAALDNGFRVPPKQRGADVLLVDANNIAIGVRRGLAKRYAKKAAGEIIAAYLDFFTAYTGAGVVLSVSDPPPLQRSYRQSLSERYKARPGPLASQGAPRGHAAHFAVDSREGHFAWQVLDGSEGDDGMRAAAAAITEAFPGKARVAVVSGDEDMASVVGPQVFWLRMCTTPSTTDASHVRVIDEAALEKEWGVKPASWDMFCALRGKKSVGIQGLGVSTPSARNLSSKFPTVEALQQAVQDGSLSAVRSPFQDRTWEEALQALETNMALVKGPSVDRVLPGDVIASLQENGAIHRSIQESMAKRRSPASLANLPALVPETAVHFRVMEPSLVRLADVCASQGLRADLAWCDRAGNVFDAVVDAKGGPVALLLCPDHTYSDQVAQMPAWVRIRVRKARQAGLRPVVLSPATVLKMAHSPRLLLDALQRAPG